MFLRQSTTQTIRFGPFLDSTDGVTAETGLTIAQADRQISKDGGAFAQSNHTGNSAHDADGWYSDDLDTTDTNTVGELILQVVVSGSIPVWVRYFVVEESIYDGLFASGGSYTAQTGDSFARLGAPAGASVSADIGTVDTVVDTILVDTNELQTDWANGGRLDLILDARASQTSVDAIDGIVDAILLDTAEIGAAGAGLTALATQASVNTIDSNVDAILVDTNELQTDWVNGGRLDLILDARASQASVDTVDSNVDAILVDTGTTIPGTIATVDSNVDAILVDTGTTLPASLTAIETDTQDIQSRIPSALVSGKMDSDTTSISGSSTAADNLEASALGIVATTVNDASATTTSFVITSSETTDDHFNGRIIVFTSGALANQATDITDYTGSTQTVTVTALTEAPANGTTFVIV